MTYRIIRELLYGRGGKRTHRHRILFTIREDTVHILYVRHTARDELEPAEDRVYAASIWGLAFYDRIHIGCITVAKSKKSEINPYYFERY